MNSHIANDTPIAATESLAALNITGEHLPMAPASPMQPVDDSSRAHTKTVNHEPPVDIAACGYAAQPNDSAGTEVMEGAKTMMGILLPSAADWDSSDFEPTPPRRSQPPVIVPNETRGRKKDKTTTLCTKAPPEPIVPRDEGCDPISVGKLVWILHDKFPLIAVAQGKAGVAWRTKSTKLGSQCSEGHQWIQVLQLFPRPRDATRV